MIDRISRASKEDWCRLIFVACFVAAFAWMLWYHFDDDAFSMLLIVMLVIVADDNVKLRRQLRKNADLPRSDI